MSARKTAPAARIVMIGTSLASPGGMTAVVRSYRESGAFAALRIDYLASFVQPGLATQLRVMAGALVRFLRLLLGGDVALVHVHSASRGSFWRKSVFCALARLARVPYIFHLHSGEFPVFYRDECGPLAKRWVRHTLENAACTIALTAGWRDALHSIAPAARVEVLGNPVASPADLPERMRPNRHVVFLGRLREKKGVFDLVRAMPAVLDRVPDATFTLAGDGDLDGVAREATALGVAHALTLPGWVDGAAKDALLTSAGVLVLPSYFEGLPVCVLEAMAVGVPVVASEVGGIPDVLQHGDCGWLVPPGDIAALALALTEALTSDTRVDAVRIRAYARARKDYSLSSVTTRLAEIYRQSMAVRRLN